MSKKSVEIIKGNMLNIKPLKFKSVDDVEVFRKIFIFKPKKLVLGKDYNVVTDRISKKPSLVFLEEEVIFGKAIVTKKVKS